MLPKRSTYSTSMGEIPCVCNQSHGQAEVGDNDDCLLYSYCPLPHKKLKLKLLLTLNRVIGRD